MRRTLAAALAALAISAVPAVAAADQAPELRGAGWVNATDLSLERLRGKVVVLYFYEEG